MDKREDIKIDGKYSEKPDKNSIILKTGHIDEEIDSEAFEKAEPIGKKDYTVRNISVAFLIVVVGGNLLALIANIFATSKGIDIDYLRWIFSGVLSIVILICSITTITIFNKMPDILIKKSETEVYFYARKRWNCVQISDIKSVDYKLSFIQNRKYGNSSDRYGTLYVYSKNNDVYKIKYVKEVTEVKARMGFTFGLNDRF